MQGEILEVALASYRLGGLFDSDNPTLGRTGFSRQSLGSE